MTEIDRVGMRRTCVAIVKEFSVVILTVMLIVMQIVMSIATPADMLLLILMLQ